jgi:hypothetical protein
VVPISSSEYHREVKAHWEENPSDPVLFNLPFDEPVVNLSILVHRMSSLMKDFLYYSRFVLDLLTFPTSHVSQTLSDFTRLP